VSNELLNLILAITSVITTITLIITLGIVAWQTTHTAKQTKLNTIISYYQYLQNMNGVLFQDEETSQQVLGESKKDVMAFIVFMNLSLAYKLHKERFTGFGWWKADEAAIVEMVKHEGMRLHWMRYKHIFERDFAQFIERILQELDREKPNSSSAPQSEQTVPGINEMSK
jgi:hypothetical protein